MAAARPAEQESIMVFEQRIANLRAEFLAHKEEFASVGLIGPEFRRRPTEWRIRGCAQRLNVEGDTLAR